MRPLLVIFIITLFSTLRAQTSQQVDSVLSVLDATIAQKPQYDRQKRLQLHDLELQFQRSRDMDEKRDLCVRLFLTYRSFRLDSALHYARLARELTAPSDRSRQVRNDINEAEALKGMGYYLQARQLLDRNLSTVDDSTMVDFYHVYYSIYYSMHQNALLQTDRARFADSLIFYREKLQHSLVDNPHGFAIGKANLLLFQGKAREALEVVSNHRVNIYSGYPFTADLLQVTFAEIYDTLGMNTEAKYYYASSAVSDIRASSKKYTALQRLAILLYLEGDISRAYRYLTCALEDISFCRIHCRINQIAEFLPIITSAYEQQSQKSSRRKLWLFVTLAMLLLVTIGVAWFVRRRNMLLARLNERLHRLNQELAVANRQLKQTNAQAEMANAQLADANRIKEEYIGQVFNLCSAYIDKQETLRRTIFNKVKGNQIGDLLKLLSDKSQAQDELHDFFRHFDAIFLSLFPDFIHEFNALLRPEEHVAVKEGELLSPELRIYALVRLGINDSTRIASFLHFSPQTVYNYRLKMRSRTEMSREEFIAAVQSLK